jgi:NAD+ kinase
LTKGGDDEPDSAARRFRVHLVGDVRNPRVAEGLADLLPWLRARVDVAGVYERWSDPFDPTGCDLVLVLGGDGALLATASRLRGGGVPLIGIRLGTFGFLAELDPAGCREQLERIFRGEGRVVTREMLHGELRRDGKTVTSEIALNDAVAVIGRPGRMIALDLEIDGEYVATYRADGLIIATPVGSTAHSLAAGGPVVEPGARSFVVTPIAAQSLSSRPLVLDSQRTVVIRRAGMRAPDRWTVVFDGQRTIEAERGDELVLRRSEQPFRMMSVVDRSFFETLREKLGWGGSVVVEKDRGDEDERA